MIFVAAAATNDDGHGVGVGVGVEVTSIVRQNIDPPYLCFFFARRG